MLKMEELYAHTITDKFGNDEIKTNKSLITFDFLEKRWIGATINEIKGGFNLQVQHPQS